MHREPTMHADAGLWPAQPTAAMAAKQAAAKKNRYYALLYREMADRRRAEGELRVNYGLLSALSHAQLRFLSGADLSAVFADLLEALLEITGSNFGLIADAAGSDASSNVVKTLAYVLPEASTIDSSVLEGIGMLVLKNGSSGSPILSSGSFPVFSANGDAAQEAVADLLDTYSFLGLPLYCRDATVGVLALGDRADGYDADMVELLQPVQTACTQMILAKRTDDRRRTAEFALSQERSSLAERVTERTTELRTVNAELEYAVRAKDEFLAMVNHELRTPLNAVLLLTEVLHKGIYGELNEKQQRSVRDIADSGRHLLSLISDILDVSKMEAGKLELDIGPCAVDSVCRSSLQLVQGMAQKIDLQVNLEIDEGIDTVYADTRRLKQMLVNLLSNAVKFTPSGGAVGLRVVADEAAEVVKFTVWDTGIGIAEEDMDKLFQPFVQIDSGHTRQYGGSGLGLVLVANMAKMHGGEVSVESKIDHGSRFTITLPLLGEEDIDLETELIFLSPEVTCTESDLQAATMHRRFSADKRSQEAAGDQSENTNSHDEPLILIADDNMPNVDALAEYLCVYDCRLAVAHDGVEAVRKAKELRPQLILMDIQMPELDGLEATRQIRASEELAGTPIVALTATVMPGDRERCLDAGMTDFLGKPVDLDSLDRIIYCYTGVGKPEAMVQIAVPTGSD